MLYFSLICCSYSFTGQVRLADHVNILVGHSFSLVSSFSLLHVTVYSIQDWLVIEEEDEEEIKCEGTVDDISETKRNAAFSPDPGNDSLLRHRRRIGTIRRSSSNPNLLSSAMDLDCDSIIDPLPRVTSPDDVTRQRCSRPRSQSLVAFSLASKAEATAKTAAISSTQVTNGHSTSPESDENINTKSGSFINVFAKKKNKEKKLSNGKKSSNNLARSNSDVGTPNGNATRTPKPPMSPKTPSKGIWKKAKNYIGGLKDTRRADSEPEIKPVPEENVSENAVVMQLEYSPIEDVEWKSVERTFPDGWFQRGYLLMTERPNGGSTKNQWNNVVC